MRKINKGEPIDLFTNFVRRNSRASWEDFVRQPNDDSGQTRLHILTEEQDCQCGYTELLIDLDNSHIDHYIKRDIEPRERFNWNNLIVAFENADFGADYKDNGYRIKRHEYAEIFNPVEEDVQTYFYYNGFGKIEPLDSLDDRLKLKVDKTVEVFNLQHPSLVKRRKDLIDSIRSYEQGGLEHEDIKICLANEGFKSLIEQFCSER